jgi:hypothetical protein
MVWLFQMSDEQRPVMLFEAKPDGTGRFFHPTALSGV